VVLLHLLLQGPLLFRGDAEVVQTDVGQLGVLVGREFVQEGVQVRKLHVVVVNLQHSQVGQFLNDEVQLLDMGVVNVARGDFKHFQVLLELGGDQLFVERQLAAVETELFERSDVTFSKGLQNLREVVCVLEIDVMEFEGNNGSFEGVNYGCLHRGKVHLIVALDN